MKFLPICTVVLVVTAILLQIMNVYMANNISTDSITATKIKNNINRLEEENIQLRTQVLRFTSFEMIASKASQLGFVEPKSFISLYSPLQVAKR